MSLVGEWIGLNEIVDRVNEKWERQINFVE
jgi:hypothetical protein